MSGWAMTIPCPGVLPVDANIDQAAGTLVASRFQCPSRAGNSCPQEAWAVLAVINNSPMLSSSLGLQGEVRTYSLYRNLCAASPALHQALMHEQ